MSLRLQHDNQKMLYTTEYISYVFNKQQEYYHLDTMILEILSVSSEHGFNCHE